MTGYYLIGIGSLIAGLGLLQLLNNLKLLFAAERVRGVIVGVAERLRPGGGHRRVIYFHPVIEFATADGATFQFTAKVGSGKRPEVGREVTVIYQAGKPDEATLKSFSGLWEGPLVALVLGGISLFAGVRKVFFGGS
ncbi:DUF3592 domain-containing protein [bacterium]|nr:DUF3592 domain-containing protein [bacterium]